MELAGLEPATSWVRSRRSPKLSYSPGTVEYRSRACTDPGAIRLHLQGYAGMGILDDAIREHLELKRRLGASDEEIEQKETEAFGPAGVGLRQPAPPAEAVPAEPAPDASAEEPEFQVQRTAPAEERSSPGADPWAPDGSDEELLAPDEVLPT